MARYYILIQSWCISHIMTCREKGHWAALQAFFFFSMCGVFVHMQMSKKEKKGRNKFLTEKITKKRDDDYKKRSLGIGIYDRRPILFFFFIFAHPCFFFLPCPNWRWSLHHFSRLSYRRRSAALWSSAVSHIYVVR